MKTTSIILSIFLPLVGFTQIGGNNVYDFLSIPVSPRSAALGGSAMAINDGDISLANENPALFSSATDGKLAVEYINYISDINFGYTSYSKHYDKIGTIGLGIQYFNGGTFIEADEYGYKYGNFSTSEFALNLSYAKALDSSFTIGATFKPIYSQLAQYNSFGLAMDVGGAYTSENRLFTASLLFKNMGAQITSYIDETAPLPFDIQAGIATKLEHAPFRFSIVAHNLQKPKLSYTQTNWVEPGNMEIDNEVEKDATILQDVMNHMIFGVEFTPTKTFFIRGGYNFMRRKELALEEKPGMTGFSWGFGFKIKRLHFSYANVKYHPSSVSNHMAITTNINDFFN
ncbi:MAG: type IX secretion system protein PorQ [Salinivirgaceae bacterium]|nr:type IX secretion system protein PorQ [Salinivirgaceae bacterium]